MGAVYQAAAHSKLFRVKKFIVKEGTVFPIQVRGCVCGVEWACVGSVYVYILVQLLKRLLLVYGYI